MRENPHAAFDVAGAGDAAWSRWCDGVDEARPNGISVPRMVVVIVVNPSEGKPSMGKSIRNLPLSCWLGSIWRRTRFRFTGSTQMAKSSSPTSSGAARCRFLRRACRCLVAMEACSLGPSLGAAIDGARFRGRADLARAREAPRPPEQERCGRRGGDLRGGGSPGPAVRAGTLDQQPGRADAPWARELLAGQRTRCSTPCAVTWPRSASSRRRARSTPTA